MEFPGWSMHGVPTREGKSMNRAPLKLHWESREGGRKPLTFDPRKNLKISDPTSPAVLSINPPIQEPNRIYAYLTRWFSMRSVFASETQPYKLISLPWSVSGGPEGSRTWSCPLFIMPFQWTGDSFPMGVALVPQVIWPRVFVRSSETQKRNLTWDWPHVHAIARPVFY